MQHQDSVFESIDVLDMLREVYPDKLSVNVASVVICSDENNAWVEVTYRKLTEIGVLLRKETTSLNQYAYELIMSDMRLPVSSNEDILRIAAGYVLDEELVRKTSSILGPRIDPEAEDEIEETEEDPDEEPDEEPEVDWEDCYEYWSIVDFLEEMFKASIEQADSKYQARLKKFKEYVEHTLENFTKGINEDVCIFSLYLNVNEESSWISFSIDEGLIEVSQGGHTYDREVGGDTYTSWIFSLWENGSTQGELYLDIDDAHEMIYLGAEISIETPDDFFDSDEV